MRKSGRVRSPLAIIVVLACASLAPGQDARPPSQLPGGPHFAGVRWNARFATEDSNADEFRAYHETVAFARQFSAQEMLDAGDRDATFRDLVLPGGKDFQGKLLALEGRLKLARKVVPPRPLREQGLEVIYECWLYPKRTDDPPLCLHVTELPEGVKPGPKFEQSMAVEFAGYYFKLMQYESQEPDPANPRERVVRKAPLLVGRSFRLKDPPAPAAADDVWYNGFVPIFLAGLGALSAAALGLSYWFKRGDRATKATLAARRAVNPFESE